MRRLHLRATSAIDQLQSCDRTSVLICDFHLPCERGIAERPISDLFYKRPLKSKLSLGKSVHSFRCLANAKQNWIGPSLQR